MSRADSTSSAQQTVIGVADMAVVKGPAGLLVTYALGSCIAVTVYDPEKKVGGMLHFMLSSSRTNPDKAKQNPAMFGDVGVPALFRQAYDLGASKDRLVVCAAGGAEVLEDNGHFKVGSRNRTMLRKMFWKNNILLAADDTGGSVSRTMRMDLETGRVTVHSNRKERVLWPC